MVDAFQAKRENTTARDLNWVEEYRLVRKKVKVFKQLPKAKEKLLGILALERP